MSAASVPVDIHERLVAQEMRSDAQLERLRRHEQSQAPIYTEPDLIELQYGQSDTIEHKPHACGADCPEHGHGHHEHHGDHVPELKAVPHMHTERYGAEHDVQLKVHACNADCPEHGSTKPHSDRHNHEAHHEPHVRAEKATRHHSIKHKPHACGADCPEHGHGRTERAENDQEGHKHTVETQSHDHGIRMKEHVCTPDCHEHNHLTDHAENNHQTHESTKKHEHAIHSIIEHKPHACGADCPEHGVHEKTVVSERYSEAPADNQERVFRAHEKEVVQNAVPEVKQVNRYDHAHSALEESYRLRIDDAGSRSEPLRAENHEPAARISLEQSEAQGDDYDVILRRVQAELSFDAQPEAAQQIVPTETKHENTHYSLQGGKEESEDSRRDAQIQETVPRLEPGDALASDTESAILNFEDTALDTAAAKKDITEYADTRGIDDHSVAISEHGNIASTYDPADRGSVWSADMPSVDGELELPPTDALEGLEPLPGDFVTVLPVLPVQERRLMVDVPEHGFVPKDGGAIGNVITAETDQPSVPLEGFRGIDTTLRSNDSSSATFLARSNETIQDSLDLVGEAIVSRIVNVTDYATSVAPNRMTAISQALRTLQESVGMYGTDSGYDAIREQLTNLLRLLGFASPDTALRELISRYGTQYADVLLVHILATITQSYMFESASAACMAHATPLGSRKHRVPRLFGGIVLSLLRIRLGGYSAPMQAASQ